MLDRVSYHAVYDNSVLSALQYANENGFKGVQLADESPHLSFERLAASDIQDIIAFVKDTGIKISLHGPDEAVSLFVTSPSLRKGIEDYYKKLVDFTGIINAQILTIHLGSTTLFRTDTDPEEPFPKQDIPIHRESVLSGLDYLLSLTQGEIAVCVENYMLDLDTLNIIEPYISDGRLFLCWDIAKSYDKPDLDEYFWKNLDVVKQVHLHDCWVKDGVKRSHMVIGSGIVDFSRYLPRFQDSNILDFCIEVRPREKALESLEALRQKVKETR